MKQLQPEKRSLPQPGLFAVLLFLLLLTGPPKFRFRDAEASLYGELDWATIVQIVAWLVGGFWVLFQLFNRARRRTLRARFSPTHRWALALILLLGLSTFVSYAPALTAFKAYQLAVLFMFGFLFVHLYGAQACLRKMLAGNLLLCAAIAASLLLFPDLVLFVSETGAPRLRGSGIAEAGTVASFAVILLATRRPRIPLLVYFPLIAGLCLMVFFSLMRTAYLVLAVFFAMRFLRSTRMNWRGWLTATVVVALVTAIAAGQLLNLGEYRDPESLLTLSDRLGLWAHFIDVTWNDSPWLGLGFVAGTRVVGMEYNPELGSGHSIFFDVFVGGGLISLAAFLGLFLWLARDAFWLFSNGRDQASFGIVSLFMAVFLVGLIGGEIDSGQMGFTFWMLVTLIPYQRKLLSQSAAHKACFSMSPRGTEGPATASS